MDFSEQQKLQSPLAFITFFVSAMVAIIGIIVVMRQMTLSGEGNFYEVAWVVIFITVLLVLVYYLLFQTELETAVDRSGFTYRYFPLIRNKRMIDFHEIISWQIKSGKSFNERMMFGYKKSIIQKKTSFMMGGEDYLEIKMKNNKQFLFSTNNNYGLSSALRNYIAEKEI